MSSRKSRSKRRVGSGRWSYPWFYPLIGLLMIPLCVAAGRTLWRMLNDGSPPFRDITASVPALLFCGGVLAWMFLYGIMPRPIKTYVLGHELTHTFCAWLSGGEAHRLRIGSRGGSVVVTDSNFFVVLAPYFFPLYAALVLMVYFIAGLFVDPEPWYLWWMVVLGISWGFHLTFTCSALSISQSDIKIYGTVFSYATILFFNLMILALGLVLAGTQSFEGLVIVFSDEIVAVSRWPLWLWNAWQRMQR